MAAPGILFLRPRIESGPSAIRVLSPTGLPGNSLCYAMLCYAKSLQSCLTLCDPIDVSPPGSSVPGILQARTPEWVAISFSNAWKRKVKVKSLSHARLLATPWTRAYQAPLSMEFSRQEYWSGVPLPSPEFPILCPFYYITLSVTRGCFKLVMLNLISWLRLCLPDPSIVKV